MQGLSLSVFKLDFCTCTVTSVKCEYELKEVNANERKVVWYKANMNILQS